MIIFFLSYFLSIFFLFVHTNRYILRNRNKYFYKNISVIAIILFSILFVFLNVYCTESSNEMGGDRGNYFYGFIYGRKDSLGLNFVFNIVKIFTDDFHVVLYLTTFICCMLTFFAYRNINEAEVNALVFLFLTDFLFTTFVNLKQCYSNAFASLFFCLIVRERTYGRDILCLVLAVLASLFHPTGVILWPILIYFWIIPKGGKNISLYLFLIFCGALFAPQICMILAHIVAIPLPELSKKIVMYFGAENARVDGISRFSFIKGFPYYVLLASGIYKRRHLLYKEKNYDKYLFLTSVGTVLYAMSVHSYWMSRFTTMFYLPMGVFYSIIVRNFNGKKKQFFKIILAGSMFILIVRYIFLIYTNYGVF